MSRRPDPSRHQHRLRPRAGDATESRQRAASSGGTNANTNAAWILSNPARKPEGAIVVTYDIKSVSVNAQRQPVMVFRMLQDGQPKPLNDFATATANPATGQKEIWDNFMGAPSLYFVFAVPQDGVTTPADFNATVSGYLRTIWNGSATGSGAGTLTGPDADGYYTGTLTGVTIPTSAVMLTGGMGYSYNCTSTLPLTQTNLAKYPVTAPTAAVRLRHVHHERLQAGRPDRHRPQRQQGCHRVHRPAGDRRGRALQQLPPGARHLHRGRLPRRTAQRRDHLLVVPHAEPRQQRLVRGLRLLRPRDSRGCEADHRVHLARRDRDLVVRRGEVSGSPELLRGLPHPRRGQLQQQRLGGRRCPNRLYRTFATGSFSGHVGDTFTNYSSSCAASQSSPATDVSVHSLAPYFHAHRERDVPRPTTASPSPSMPGRVRRTGARRVARRSPSAPGSRRRMLARRTRPIRRTW